MQANFKFWLLVVLLSATGCSTTQKHVEQDAAEQEQANQVVSEPVVKAEETTVKEEPKKIEEVVTEVVEPVVVETPPPVEETKPVEVIPPVVAVEKKPEPQKKPQALPTDPNTFLVVTEEKTKKHPAFGSGSEHGFTVNGVQGKELSVTRGEQYKFSVDTGVKHDFYLTTSPVGWGTATYSEGVEGQFTYEGDVTFKPNVATPDVLYYQCRNHKSMGGKIYVLDKGETLASVKAKEVKPVAKTAGAGGVAQKADERAVKQKISYASMLLMGRNVKNVEASGNQQAIAKITQAKADVEEAKKLMAAGSFDDALAKADEGIRTIMTASMKTASANTVDNSALKTEYEELINALDTYSKSYDKNVKRAKKAGQALKATLNQADYDALVAEGKKNAASGNYTAANAAMKKAQTMITNTLTTMLQSQTIEYDKNFETPKEEYEYELARTESYEELIPLAIEQRQPSKGLMTLMNTYVDKAKKIKGEGLEIAAKGDYKMGIMAMQAATDNLIRALRAVGVQ